jgi:deoxyhypusine synthase
MRNFVPLRRGLNRIGNLIVPNDNYCKFEDWMMPILDAMKKEQDEEGTKWTPSKAGLAALSRRSFAHRSFAHRSFAHRSFAVKT